MHKKIKLSLNIGLLLATLLLPLSAFSHGGVSKQIGTYTVYLNQSPMSPLLGELVNFNFVIRGDTNDSVTALPVTLTLIDTFYGDESKDQEILKQNFVTDNNGAFNFSYTFNKENYFDVDLQFIDPQTGKPLETGFLVQPRANQKPRRLALAAGLGLVMGVLLVKFLKKKHVDGQN